MKFKICNWELRQLKPPKGIMGFHVEKMLQCNGLVELTKFVLNNLHTVFKRITFLDLEKLETQPPEVLNTLE